MFSRFFVYRPIFAWVIALGILLFGGLALVSLPVEEYPNVAPPSLELAIVYPGADAKTIEQNVVQVIEQELNGVKGYLYMASTSRSNGTATITVTFESGTNIDVAQTNVQNKLNTIQARLPQEVQRQGISITQSSSGIMMVVALQSKSGSTDSTGLGNIAADKVIDELRRVSGVGDILLFGSQNAMRIWLDPDKLANFGLSPADALLAVQEQNSQTAGGSLGDQPIADDAGLNATIITQNRFTKPEQFKNVILRANPDGSTVTIGDVARVELGAQDYLTSATLNRKPIAGIAVKLRTGANALKTEEGVENKMRQLQSTLPPDVSWSVPYDTTPFIKISVSEVEKTLRDAMFLVFLVMLLFLQNLRATIISTIVVPVALAGGCLGLALFGFSLNVLTLLAMVLAIGILVDDAIVVIENVERIMATEHLSPKDATVKAMSEIQGALVGITLVLTAVFLPMAFFPGSTGGIYRQFSVTLAVSIIFSALLAFTLTPALCGSLLKPHAAPGAAPARKSRFERFNFIQPFFNWFNHVFERTTQGYKAGVARMVTAPLAWLGVFVLLAVGAVFLFTRVPGGFLPEEDQGYVITIVQAPPGATTQRTNEAIDQVENFYDGQATVQSVTSVRGFNFFGQGQSSAMIFASMHPWDQRKGLANSARTLVNKALMALLPAKEAIIFTLSPPAIQALGNATGFSFRLEAQTPEAEVKLQDVRNMMLDMAGQSKVLANVRPEGLEPAPQLDVNIDRVRARALKLSIADVNNTIAIAFGSAYVNDFNLGGRVRRVYMQADAPYRMTPEDVLNLRVRNTDGQMVPFGAFTTAAWASGSPQRERYNAYSSASIAGESAPGYSSGDALKTMETLAEKLPPGFGYEWTGTSYEEKQAGGQIGALLGLSMVVVFLLLAALYESWTVPVSVLLVVPLGVLGAALLTLSRGFAADVYFNVGLITIIGLSAKNAILIVEFAIDQEQHGETLLVAVVSAARLRLRPIIMTSLAFILGMVPLAFSSGAGSASRQAVGTGVMGGMLTATLLGIFFTPVFYVAVRRWLSRKPTLGTGVDGAEPEAGGSADRGLTHG